MIRELIVIVSVSETSRVPEILRSKSNDAGGPSLKFMPLEKKKRAEARKMEAAAIGDIEMRPSESHALGWLRAMKVVARMSGKMPDGIFGDIYFKFTCLGREWTVEISHVELGQERVLRSFKITAVDIENMRRAGKTAQLPFDDGFVHFNCFSLIQ